ncbi:MAG: hypothetical protein E8D50_12155 [Nitrospira sp.]|nr:hypothetical protein [Nitrospira sp.]TKB52557.1 MAG: hypothetical protein E8D50_12155 [Nitrospira sp.]
MGDAKHKAVERTREPVAVETVGGLIHVEWDPASVVTPLGQWLFFIELLNVSKLFDAWVADCPLTYQSPNAPDKRAVLATVLVSILAGPYRYAPLEAIRHDPIPPELLGVRPLVSEDAVRRGDRLAGSAPGHNDAATADHAVDCGSGRDGALCVREAGGRGGGYNRKKPGRPAHSDHATRADGGAPGNQTAPQHGMPGFWSGFDHKATLENRQRPLHPAWWTIRHHAVCRPSLARHLAATG